MKVCDECGEIDSVRKHPNGDWNCLACDAQGVVVRTRLSTAFRLAPNLIKRLDAQAKRRVVSRNLLVNAAIEQALVSWESDPCTCKGGRIGLCASCLRPPHQTCEPYEFYKNSHGWQRSSTEPWTPSSPCDECGVPFEEHVV